MSTDTDFLLTKIASGDDAAVNELSERYRHRVRIGYEEFVFEIHEIGNRDVLAACRLRGYRVVAG